MKCWLDFNFNMCQKVEILGSEMSISMIYFKTDFISGPLCLEEETQVRESLLLTTYQLPSKYYCYRKPERVTEASFHRKDS